MGFRKRASTTKGAIRISLGKYNTKKDTEEIALNIRS